MHAAPGTHESSVVRLEESLFEQAIGSSNEASFPAFTKKLRGTLRGADVEPLPGLELAQSLEIVMKLARHHLETMPMLQRELEDRMISASQSGPILQKARQACDTVVSAAVWLRNQGAPHWAFRFLEAPDAFRQMSDLALRFGEKRQALHWAVATMLMPSTLLGRYSNPATLPHRADVDRVVRLQHELGAQAMKEELEAWHDLYSSYRLFA